MVGLRQPLRDLTFRLPRQVIEVSIAHKFANKVRAGHTIEDVNLFSAALTVLRGDSVSNANLQAVLLC